MTKYLVIILIYLSSCQNDSKNIMVEYYDNGQIAKWLDTSNSEKMIARSFYRSGQVEMEAILKYGKFNGLRKDYYENGKIKKIENYNMDKLVGKAICLYETGDTAAITYYEDGNLISEKQYNLLGKQVGSIENGVARIFDNDDHLMLLICVTNDTAKYNRIKFDQKGNLIDYGGELFCLTKEDTLLLNNTNLKWKEEIKKFK